MKKAVLVFVVAAVLCVSSSTITIDPDGRWLAKPDPASVQRITETVIRATK